MAADAINRLFIFYNFITQISEKLVMSSIGPFQHWPISGSITKLNNLSYLELCISSFIRTSFSFPLQFFPDKVSCEDTVLNPARVEQAAFSALRQKVSPRYSLKQLPINSVYYSYRYFE
jgi:hypothetical protein